MSSTFVRHCAAALAGLCVGAGATSLMGQIRLEPIGTYATNTFAEGGAEIPAYDGASQRLFVVNGAVGGIDVIDISDPVAPALLFTIDLAPWGASANSVAAWGGAIAVAVQAEVKTDPGRVVFFDADGSYHADVQVGSLPDMLTFTPDGRWVLVANEGEPNDDYTIDPEGSVSVIDLADGIDNLTQNHVRTAGFSLFNNGLLAPSVRIFGPGATVAQDIEPEYIAVSPDSRTAWVSLQENNAIAVLNIAEAKITRIHGLGFKNHRLGINGIDASDRDGGPNIRPWPIYGMFMPDTIASFTVRGRTYIIGANEGDARDYAGFAEEARVKNLDLDPIAFPDAADLQRDENLGRLTVTRANGDADGNGVYEELYVFGARSFTIWSAEGRRVFDSGNGIERAVQFFEPENFNSNHEENNSADTRSDNKGPEPEGLAVAEIEGRTYAFIGLERQSSIIVADLSDPTAPRFMQYLSTRDFNGDPELGTAGDLGPEGIIFIPADESPIGEPLLVVAYEVSGTTTIFRIDVE